MIYNILYIGFIDIVIVHARIVNLGILNNWFTDESC